MKIDHEEEVFEGEGIREVEVTSKPGACQPGLRETLEAFFLGVESQLQGWGTTVGLLVESLQQHLHLSEEDAEHIVDLLGGDLSAHIGKEEFVQCALGWWEGKIKEQENEVIEEMVKDDFLGEARFRNQPDRSCVRRSSLENLEDLHFLEEQKVELEERLRLSGELEEKWRRQYFAKAAQCELEEARFLVFGLHYFQIIAPFQFSLILFEGEWRMRKKDRKLKKGALSLPSSWRKQERKLKRRFWKMRLTSCCSEKRKG